MDQNNHWRRASLNASDSRRGLWQNAPSTPVFAPNQASGLPISITESNSWNQGSQNYSLNPAAASFQAQFVGSQNYASPRNGPAPSYQPPIPPNSRSQFRIPGYPTPNTYGVANNGPSQPQQPMLRRPEIIPPPFLTQRDAGNGIERVAVTYGPRSQNAPPGKIDSPPPISLTLSQPAPEVMSSRQPYTIPVLVRQGFGYKQKDYFTVGKVFEADVMELADDISATTASGTTASSMYLKPRYYVVIEQGLDHFTALGLYSYSKCGVANRGIKSEHCIIYSNDKAGPFVPMPSERPRPGEEGMKSVAIRVERADQESMHLRDATRLNLGREFSPLDYTRLPVKHYGKVDRRYLAALISQWGDVRGARVERVRQNVRRDEVRREAKNQRAKGA